MIPVTKIWGRVSSDPPDVLGSGKKLERKCCSCLQSHRRPGQIIRKQVRMDEKLCGTIFAGMIDILLFI